MYLFMYLFEDSSWCDNAAVPLFCLHGFGADTVRH